MKNLIGFALMLCMVLSLCACGAAETEVTTEPAAAAIQETEDALTEYTVTVVDEEGNPVAGVMVQLCMDACYPGVTDEHGAAKYSVAEADYKASLLSLPEGYEYADETREFYFEAGSTAVTITLKAVD